MSEGSAVTEDFVYLYFLCCEAAGEEGACLSPCRQVVGEVTGPRMLVPRTSLFLLSLTEQQLGATSARNVFFVCISENL